MSRTLATLIVTAVTALCVVLVLGVLADTGTATHAQIPPPPQHVNTAPRAPAATGQTCYSWAFLNNTGQDMNDLHVRLKSITSISSVYTGTLNPFGAPDGSSGYNAGTDVYNLNFSNGIAFNGDTIQIGLCTNSASLRLASPPAFFWTLTGTQTLPDPLFAGLTINWLSANHAQINLYNEQNLTLTLNALNVLDPGMPLTLDDLNGDVAMLLPFAREVITVPETLTPAGSLPFDVFLAGSLQGNHPFVVEASLATEDDPGNTLHLLAQSLSPPIITYLPILLKNH